MVNLSGKPNITYPCFWEYKIIFDVNNNAENNIKKILNHTKFKMEISKHSKSGSYISYNLNVFVNNEEERLRIFAELKKIAKFVL